MGVPEDLLPRTLDHARMVAELAGAIFAPPDADSRMLDNALMRNGIRAERALPGFLRPVMAPILRPVVSFGIWGVSNTIVKQMEQHPDNLHAINHPVVRVLRRVISGTKQPS